MVIGNGMIAKRFSAYNVMDQWLVFASGVSHSLTIDEEAFERERILLQKSIREHEGKTVVYFSTCSIYDPSLQTSRYVIHKQKMEELIKTLAPSYIIFRVSNPVGKTNNHHTVLNYFVEHIIDGTMFTVWKYASRNLIDIDDMYRICQELMLSGEAANAIINIANPVNYPVTAIIEAIENQLDKKGNYTLADKGSSPLIDTTAIRPLIERLKIDFGPNYLKKMLQKYYGQ